VTGVLHDNDLYAGKLCGYRHMQANGKASPRCGKPVKYAFTLKPGRHGSPRSNGAPGLSCAEHAIILRHWSNLERVWSV
jgi:hypothetical protein